MTLDTNITIKYGGCRGMEPIIINGSGCHVGIEYLRRNYETAVKMNAQLLQLSIELQEQRDEALEALAAAQDRVEDLQDYDRTISDFEAGTGRV